MPPKFKKYLRNSDLAGSKENERINLLGEYHDDEEDDDFFYNRSPAPRGGERGQQRSTDPKIQRVQGQVDEVMDVMKDNMEKVIDRGERLDNLEEKTDELMYSASIFKVSAKGLRSHFWWQQCKMRVLLLAVVLVILIIVFIPIILKTRGH
ncbi:vesicle-associated membrane protein 4-like [Diadema antillarum]|uniref:vesicle-associated membrane protein 4-like n=1 Tax=Diadema antillarum TaxID=105358 RepID=UPI003A83BF80